MNALEETMYADSEKEAEDYFALILRQQVQIDDLSAELVGKCQRCKLLKQVEGKEVRQ